MTLGPRSEPVRNAHAQWDPMYAIVVSRSSSRTSGGGIAMVGVWDADEQVQTWMKALGVGVDDKCESILEAVEAKA